MRTIRLFLAIPAWALCAGFSGTVVDLSGSPVSGAVVRSSVDSATTTENGTWSLARPLSAAPRDAKPVSVASHLVVRNGRPFLVLGGVDALGRRSLPATTASHGPASARSTAADGTDTVKLFWKRKRLVVLPVASVDSTGIVLRIDTAWSDDADIPWNPAIAYGSVLDGRDGRTYRTIDIGPVRWMAENLNHATDSSWWFKGIDSTRLNAEGGYDSLDENPTQGARFGRYYTWTAATGAPDSCKRVSTCTIHAQGICPSGWHLPYEEWDLLGVHGDSTAAERLRSTSGWGGIHGSVAGQDIWGFRGLPAGALRGGQQIGRQINGWWTPREVGTFAPNGYYRGWESNRSHHDALGLFEGSKGFGLAVRCVKDAP